MLSSVLVVIMVFFLLQIHVLKEWTQRSLKIVLSDLQQVSFSVFRLGDFGNLCSYTGLFMPVVGLLKIFRLSTTMPSIFYWYCQCAKAYTTSPLMGLWSYSQFYCWLFAINLNCFKTVFTTTKMGTFTLLYKCRNEVIWNNVLRW